MLTITSEQTQLVVTSDIAEVLRGYPFYPYHRAFMVSSRRHQLIDFIVTHTAQDPMAHRSQHQDAYQHLIRTGIEQVLGHEQSFSDPSQSKQENVSHWFG
ncbi:hypothetical protein XM38_015020 [Halomicronema hongdechloris C2206]|uniref:Uncharacterized protein n=1 Tax=Halomicronema hongdechloris C2206 TaxID=1641165 RepID=A0A1Z3HJR8_9CYAN|nr:hypothetical protein [Halomicronema hongdechloris]ASC70562.1 hypothetical protein XM38_015020 [Halomicronema hongdechloris C2206]